MNRLATFAHAISSTMAAAPNSTPSGRADGPSISSGSGRATIRMRSIRRA